MYEQIFTIHGMHCEACTKLSAKRIKSIDGVVDVTVDLESKTATLTTDRPITTNDINAVLEDGEYRAEEHHE